MAKPDTAERETHVERKIRLVVKGLLASRDMTGAQFAEEFGMSAQQIYNRLNGTKPFTATEIARMSDYFGVAIQTFYDGPEGLFGPREPVTLRVGRNSHNACCIPRRPRISHTPTSSGFAVRDIYWTDCQDLASRWVVAA